MAFWGGLLIASAVGLQLLARALSEFSIPDVTHPCLLVDSSEARAIAERLGESPWREFWAEVRREAEQGAWPKEWVAYARMARANAVAYAVTGEVEYGERAARMLARFPTRLYAARMKCRKLARVTAYWAEGLDLIYPYLQRWRRTAPDSSALGRLARRLYYTDWRRDDEPAVARLWRGAGLVLAGLALADWDPPAGLVGPRMLYAEGRAELRGAVRAAFSEAAAKEPERLGEALAAFIPVAMAIERTCGERVVDRREVRQAAHLMLVASVGPGRMLSPQGKIVAMPSYLLAGAGLYPEAFAGQTARAVAAGRWRGDAVEALCCLRPMASYAVARTADAAAVGSVIALRAGAESHGVVVVAGPLEPGNATGAGAIRAPVAVFHGREVVRGTLRVGLAEAGKQEDEKGRHKARRAVEVDVSAGAGGQDCAVGRWEVDAGRWRAAVRWQVVSGPSVLGWVAARADERDVGVSLWLAPSQWAVTELGRPGQCSRPASTWRRVVKSGEEGRFVVALCPRRLRWKLEEDGEEEVVYRLEGPGLVKVWHLMLAAGCRERALESGAISAHAAAVMWVEERGEVRDVIVVDGRRLAIEGKVVWESQEPETAWWAPRARVAANKRAQGSVGE